MDNLPYKNTKLTFLEHICFKLFMPVARVIQSQVSDQRMDKDFCVNRADRRERKYLEIISPRSLCSPGFHVDW